MAPALQNAYVIMFRFEELRRLYFFNKYYCKNNYGSNFR
jgi:hypothetical protein